MAPNAHLQAGIVDASGGAMIVIGGTVSALGPDFTTDVAMELDGGPIEVRLLTCACSFPCARSKKGIQSISFLIFFCLL